ncbi:hypothetical protein PG985_008100 [Apiospora marii]|uniref:Uncharacterized protein n=1 Tax=Apiospora marii TaxID=335849 RepID=A0ABR1RAF8_9PEZI
MPRFSSRSSSVSAYNDDIDAITPCPLPASTTETTQSKSPASLSSSSSCYSTSSRNHSEEELRQSSRRGSSSSHRRILAAVFGRGRNPRSPSPTSSSLSDANSEEDLDMFASRRRDSVRALEQGAGGDPERLWRRMLELQQTYGCYNSARMSAALESGDASLRPSRACLDLLNENMVLLPDDADYALRDSNNQATAAGHPASH